jgi:acyl-homoserine lactone synthase
VLRLHIVTRENRHLYEQEMIEQHRLRHACYIVERKWDGLQDRGGLEYDQFDDDDTIYLLAIEDGRLVGGGRMYPTTKPHLMSHIWPELAAVKGIPAGPDIFEWTRLYVTRDRRGDGRYGTAVVGQLFAGGLEFALEEGMSELSLQFEAFWFPRLQQHGWKINPLGLPTKIKDDWWIGASIPISPAVVRSTRAFYGISGPILMRRGISQPALHIAA